MYFFTADEHYCHKNIIKYCNRPFNSVEEMNETMIKRHNALVRSGDITVHAGDFALVELRKANRIINRLNGKHIFLLGSHDHWLRKTHIQIWEKKIEGKVIVACHYAMRVWPKSHYGSWQVHGHSHGRLAPQGKQWDVGVDNNGFAPVPFHKLRDIMKGLEDNPNQIKQSGRNKR